MIYFGTVLIGVFVAEVFCRFPFLSILRSVLRTAKKAALVIASPKISDHWKEKVILKYASQLASQTFRIAIIFIFLFVIIGGIILGFEFIFSVNLFEWVVSNIGLIVTTAVSLFYVILRKQVVAG